MPKFEIGHPGGPGRPRGSRNATNLSLDQIAEDEVETLVRQMIEEGCEGDRVAARLALSRIWSAPKGRPIEVELPEIRTSANLPAAHAAGTTAVSDGRLTPQDGAGLSALLEQAGCLERAPLDGSRIREVSRKVLGRDQKIPRAQALEEGSDTFREIDDDFERRPAALALDGDTWKRTCMHVTGIS